MMVAFAILDITLHIVAALATFLWIRQRLQAFSQETREEMQRVILVTESKAPLISPDPRVDELIRVVSNLRGAEALKHVFGGHK